MKKSKQKALLRSSDDLIAAVEQYGSLPNASNRAEARAHFYERRKYAKKQAIQYSDLITEFRDYPPKSSAGTHEPKRLCNQLLSGQENHHS